MVEQFEVELRGPLSENDYQRLDGYLAEHGEFKISQQRFLIHYSSTGSQVPEYDETLDVRLRVTNGHAEIIVKLGEFGGKYRREGSVFLQPGQFDRSVELLSMLGFRKGVACYRKIKRYLYDGTEFALVEVPGYTYFYEAEQMAAEDSADKAYDKVAATLKGLGLRIFSQDEFYAFIDDLDRNANELFDYEQYEPGQIDPAWL